MLKKRAENPASDQRCYSDARSVAFQYIVSWGFMWFPVSRRHLSHGLCREWTPSPPSFLKQAFNILTGGNHEGLAVDSPEPPYAKPPHPMPLLGFSKEGLNPDF